MKREDILNELKKFKVVPHNTININDLTDKQLELKLNLLKSMSDSGDNALKD